MDKVTALLEECFLPQYAVMDWVPILFVGVFPLLWRKLHGGSAQS